MISLTRIRASQFRAMVLLLAAASCGRAATGQSFPLADGTGLVAHDIKVEATTYQGRKAVRLSTDKTEAGFAMIPGVDFQDGTIEVDLVSKTTTTPGVRNPGFTGIAFRTNSSASEYEMVYLRPKNALAEDQAMRNHSIQYCAEPGYGWYHLRREWPFVYESYVDIQPETWIKLKIEVAGRSARVYINGSSKPTLVVDGMKSPNLHGGIALWGYAGEESYFSNMRITPAPPQPVKNGSDAAGEWSLRFPSDAGPFEGTMKLARDGAKLTGTWSGAFGNESPVAGTWRDGHIELSFPGEWPKDLQDGAPGPVKVFLEGWIDDNAGKGRMRVDGHADGPWLAQRKEPANEGRNH